MRYCYWLPVFGGWLRNVRGVLAAQKPDRKGGCFKERGILLTKIISHDAPSLTVGFLGYTTIVCIE